MFSTKKNTHELLMLNLSLKKILIDDYIQKHLYNNPRYQDKKRLNIYEHQGFSQNGEDGIINEIFNRIGTTNKFFVEFGCGKNGTENNTIALLIEGWQGCWLDGHHRAEERIKEKYASFLKNNKLKMKTAMIDAENICDLFQELDTPEEFDLLSIDIDGNDYWIWKTLSAYKPRVVILEYNATFQPHTKWVMTYNPKHNWDGTNYFGASLKSFELLGEKLEYKLVGCNFAGNNAFFVRNDCVHDHFCSPFTAENHYEPSRNFLHTVSGHPNKFGSFESI